MPSNNIPPTTAQGGFVAPNTFSGIWLDPRFNPLPWGTFSWAANILPFLEGDNVHTDVENVAGGGQEDTFTGDSAPNVLDGGGGENFVDGGAGADEMRGGATADTLVARDGASLDKGTCGGGFDFVIADRGDGIASDCEVVDRFLGDRPMLGRIAAVLPHGRQIAMRVVHAHRFVLLTTHANLPMGSSLARVTSSKTLSSRTDATSAKTASCFPLSLSTS